MNSTTEIRYYIASSGFPCGGYCAFAVDGIVLRLGVPHGELPKRHKTPETAKRAVETYYKRIWKTAA